MQLSGVKFNRTAFTDGEIFFLDKLPKFLNIEETSNFEFNFVLTLKYSFKIYKFSNCLLVAIKIVNKNG